MATNCRFGDLSIHCNIDFSGVNGVYNSLYGGVGFSFKNSKNFTGNVKVSPDTTNASNMFNGCTNFDGTVFLSPNVTNCAYMFSNCIHFNHPVTNTENVTNCAGMYQFCNNFDLPVTIGGNVTDCAYMFYGCTNFTNQHMPLVIPNSVTKVGSMLGGCYNFTSDIILGTGINYAFSLFSRNNEYGALPCNNWFNSRVEFWGVINNFCETFYNCTNYNKYFAFPAVTSGCSCRLMFAGCKNFAPDSPIDIPDGVNDCFGMFMSASNFNVHVTIPSSVESCQDMFEFCSNFSQDVYVHDGCEYYEILRGCFNYHATISIPYNNTEIGLGYGIGYRANNGHLGATVIVRDIGKVFRAEQAYYNNGMPKYCVWVDGYGGSPYAGDHYYDSPTIIPDGTTSASSYFQSCTSYNQSTSIPSSVVTCYKMFSQCSSFNSQITFESSEEGV